MGAEGRGLVGDLDLGVYSYSCREYKRATAAAHAWNDTPYREVVDCTCPSGVDGEMSPNPTVLIVTIDQ